MNIRSLVPEQLSQPDLHSVLLTAVAPRPICFASTVDLQGRVNLSPFSFFNVFSSNPPLLVFSPARSGRDNTLKHTHENVKEVPEVVINIVNHPIVEQMSLSSTAYEKGINEFKKSGLTEVPSDVVQPPRVGESPVSFECSVQEIIELGNTPGAGNLILAKVLRIHLNTDYLTQNKLDTQKLDLVGRMGGSWYIRAKENALFEIPKPIRSQGIGVDALPKGIRESTVLTGNNLGRLGNLEALPSQETVEAIGLEADIQKITTQVGPNLLEKQKRLHLLAQEALKEGTTEKAMAILLYAENLSP